MAQDVSRGRPMRDKAWQRRGQRRWRRDKVITKGQIGHASVEGTIVAGQRSSTDTHVKSAVSIRGRSSQCEHLWSAVRDCNLEVAIRVLLLENNPHRLFNVYQEFARLVRGFVWAILRAEDGEEEDELGVEACLLCPGRLRVVSLRTHRATTGVGARRAPRPCGWVS